MNSTGDAQGAPGRARPRYRCGLYAWRDGVLHGFAEDLGEPARSLTIALEALGRTVAEVSTSEPRPDLAEAAPLNVAGFTFDFSSLPDDVLAGLEAALAAAAPEAKVGVETLALRVGEDGARIDLGSAGLTFVDALAQIGAARRRAAPKLVRRADASGPRFIAGVDSLKGTTLRGWAVDLADVKAPVGLSLLAKGRLLVAFETGDHRADIASLLVGNIAGFELDLAALPPERAQALAEALEDVDFTAPAPPGRVALRVEADRSLIDLGAFGVTAGALMVAIGRAEAAPETPPLPAAAKPPTREQSALRWLLAYIGAGSPDDASPSRRFVARLLADIERDPAVSPEARGHAREIAPLFDPFTYLDRLEAPDEAVANPLLHYVRSDWREGAAPHPLFSPAHYKGVRGEIAGDPLLDFLRVGARLDVDPHPLFDMAFYRAQLGAETTANPLLHYIEAGGARRLDPSPLFDTRAFLDRFGLGAEIENPLEAFLVTPAFWDFELVPTFDAALYRHQIEIERGERLYEPPWLHYLAGGFRNETLLPNLLFDPAFYRERNRLELDEPALLHYLREGEAAGLPCHPIFLPEFYNSERGVEGGAGALEHALHNPSAFRTDPRMTAPIDSRLFEFVRSLVAENGNRSFRLATYRETNPDLAWMSDKALAEHYRAFGEREGRLASYTVFMQSAGLRVRDLELGFDLDEYVEINSDLGNYAGKFLFAFYHYSRHGRREKRKAGKWEFHIEGLALRPASAAAPLAVTASRERVDVCILIHAFYPDLLAELVGFAQNFSGVSFDIFINVVDLAWTPDVQNELRAICPGAFVMLSNDLGRDIGGFMRLLTHIDIGRYDVFAFLHSKKSPHVVAEKGQHWRRQLLHAIAGTPEIATDCVRMFKDDPRVGMIGAKEWRSSEMGRNVEQYERLLDLLDVRGKNRELDYLSGFMFLVRSDVVARLFEVVSKLEFEFGGDKDVEFHRDGQIAHGVERALPALVREMGYEIHYR